LFKAHEPIARYEVAPESSCCVIKPHAIKSRVVGQILKDIKEGGFQITAMQVFHMDRSQATEFYEVYSGIKEYHSKYCRRISLA
jgi:nucleoside-diphosphate kinase